MINLGFPYYFFGSPDSQDIDVMIDHPAARSHETDSQIIKELKNQHPTISQWNINIVRIQNGIIVDSIPNKGGADSSNNSLFQTFKHHAQVFDFPLDHMVPRNLPLACVKCVNASLMWFKGNNRDEEYRTRLRPVMATGDWNDSVDLLPTLSFLDSFTNRDEENKNILKSLAFNISQTILLFEPVELYTKGELSQYYPEISPLLKRENCNPDTILRKKLKELHNLIKASDFKVTGKNEIEWSGNIIDTKRCRLV